MKTIKTFEQLRDLVNTNDSLEVKKQIEKVKCIEIVENSNIWKENEFYIDKKIKSKIKTFDDLLHSLNIPLRTYLNIKNIIKEKNGEIILRKWGYQNAVVWLNHNKDVRRKIINFANKHKKENSHKSNTAIFFSEIYKVEIAKEYNENKKSYNRVNINKRIAGIDVDINNPDIVKDCPDNEYIQKLESENSKLKSELNKLQVENKNLKEKVNGLTIAIKTLKEADQFK